MSGGRPKKLGERHFRDGLDTWQTLCGRPARYSKWTTHFQRTSCRICRELIRKGWGRQGRRELISSG